MEEFREAIVKLHLDAGAPSSRTVAARIGKISHSTVNEVIRGKAIPLWPTAAKIVEALGGNPASFQPMWIAARERIAGTSGKARLDDPWISAEVEKIAVGDETVVDGEWALITGVGADSHGQVHVYLGRTELVFIPGAFVMIRGDKWERQ